jgi:sporulation protein YlmC with PRC-barrel domain
VRTLSSILRRQVVTDTGRSLGRCYDLRGELSANQLRITGLSVGRRGLLEHLGIREQKPRAVVPWSSVVRIEGKRIIVRDSAVGTNPDT